MSTYLVTQWHTISYVSPLRTTTFNKQSENHSTTHFQEKKMKKKTFKTALHPAKQICNAHYQFPTPTQPLKANSQTLLLYPPFPFPSPSPFSLTFKTKKSLSNPSLLFQPIFNFTPSCLNSHGKPYISLSSPPPISVVSNPLQASLPCVSCQNQISVLCEGGSWELGF